MEAITPTLTDEQAEFLIVLASVARCKPGSINLRSYPDASLMLNLSNLAWYGDSLAQPQHLQIARLRALETGRPMLRATNTGMTAVVAPDGEVAAVLPAFKAGALHAEVRGYQGLTPYARWGYHRDPSF